MCRSIKMFAVTALTIGFCWGCAAKHADFGQPQKLSKNQAVPIAKVVKDPEAYAGRYVRVAGVVSSVCAHKGCWLRMNDGQGGQDVFVKFNCPIEGRLVPMTAVGKRVEVEGRLEVSEISQAEARHYAQDAGKSAEEIAQITGATKQLQINAPAARVYGLKS